jgi:hypothetical protein
VHEELLSVIREIWKAEEVQIDADRFALTEFLKEGTALLTTNQHGATGHPALQRQNAEILKQIFPEKEYRGLSAYSAGGNMYTDPGTM